MPKFIVKISTETDNIFINDKDIECYILSSKINKVALQKLMNELQALKKIVLFEGEGAADIYMDYGADGIVADLSASTSIKKDIINLRKKLGENILGIISRNRRHEAMLVSENEPDFIIFKVWEDGKEKTIELSKWYSELFLIQQAVELSELTDYKEYYADLVILSPELYKILVAKN